MRWRALLAVILLAPLWVTSVAAQTSADVAVAVRPPVDGVLSASITGAAFSVVDYVPEGAADQISRGVIQLWVVDTTGMGTAWTVRARAESDFTAATDQTIAASNLQLTAPDESARKSGADRPGNQPSAFTVASMSTSASVPIAQCATGNCQGEFQLAFPTELRVPAGTLAGTYRTSIVVEVLASDDGK